MASARILRQALLEQKQEMMNGTSKSSTENLTEGMAHVSLTGKSTEAATSTTSSIITEDIEIENLTIALHLLQSIDDAQDVINKKHGTTAPIIILSNSNNCEMEMEGGERADEQVTLVTETKTKTVGGNGGSDENLNIKQLSAPVPASSGTIDQAPPRSASSAMASDDDIDKAAALVNGGGKGRVDSERNMKKKKSKIPRACCSSGCALQ